MSSEVIDRENGNAVASFETEEERCPPELMNNESLQTLYGSALRARREAEERKAAADEEIRGLEVEIEGYRRAAGRLGVTLHDDGQSQDWSGIYVTDAIVRALEEAGRPLSPAHLVAILKARGLDVTDHYVSNTLLRLKGRRVRRLGRGEWVPLPAQGGRGE